MPTRRLHYDASAAESEGAIVRGRELEIDPWEGKQGATVPKMAVPTAPERLLTGCVAMSVIGIEYPLATPLSGALAAAIAAASCLKIALTPGQGGWS